MSGRVASLNASVAGALAMFEVRRRRGVRTRPADQEGTRMSQMEPDEGTQGTQPDIGTVPEPEDLPGDPDGGSDPDPDDPEDAGTTEPD
jgi:hypothetical protein